MALTDDQKTDHLADDAGSPRIPLRFSNSSAGLPEKPDTLSKIAAALALSMPTATDSTEDCISFVANMNWAFQLCGQERLRFAWLMGKVLARLKEERGHGNRADVDQTWDEFCKHWFRLCGKTGDRYIKVAEVVMEEELGRLTLADAYRRIDELARGDEEVEIADQVAADTTPEGDETGGNTSAESATEPTDPRPQDPIERKKEELRQMVEDFYGCPKAIRKSLQELLELIVRENGDAGQSLATELSPLVEDITNRMSETHIQIKKHTAEMWDQFLVHCPHAQVAPPAEEPAGPVEENPPVAETVEATA